MKRITTLYEARAVVKIWNELCEKAKKAEGTEFDEIISLKSSYEPRYEKAKRFIERYYTKR